MGNRKAMTHKLMGLLITIFVAVILMLFVAKWSGMALGKSKIAVCGESVALTSAITEKTKVVAPDLRCERIQWHITKKDYYDKKENKIDYDKLKRDVGDKMVNYWEVVAGNGKHAPFEKWSGNNVSCLIGYEITFDKDFVEAQEITEFTYLDQWLENNVPSGKIESYSNYMAFMALKSSTIDTSEKHVIMWRADADEDDWEVLVTSVGVGAAAGTFIPVVGNFAGAVLGAIGGTVLYVVGEGDTGVANSLMFVPEKSITGDLIMKDKDGNDKKMKICDELYN